MIFKSMFVKNANGGYDFFILCCSSVKKLIFKLFTKMAKLGIFLPAPIYVRAAFKIKA